MSLKLSPEDTHAYHQSSVLSDQQVPDSAMFSRHQLRCHTQKYDQVKCRSSYFVFFKCCVTSTETIRTIRPREPRTSTSTFPQLLSAGWAANNLLSVIYTVSQLQRQTSSRDSANRTKNVVTFCLIARPLRSSARGCGSAPREGPRQVLN